MKASERSRRFREQDATERRMPSYLFAELRGWTIWLALLAGGCTIYALEKGGWEPWSLAGVLALGALLCWLLSESA